MRLSVRPSQRSEFVHFLVRVKRCVLLSVQLMLRGSGPCLIERDRACLARQQQQIAARHISERSRRVQMSDSICSPGTSSWLRRRRWRHFPAHAIIHRRNSSSSSSDGLGGSRLAIRQMLALQRFFEACIHVNLGWPGRWINGHLLYLHMRHRNSSDFTVLWARRNFDNGRNV